MTVCECGTEFTPRRKGQQFCSRRCAALNGSRVSAANPKPRRATVKSDGYLMEWDAEQGKYLYQHRLVMERHLGRPLTSVEVVHHVNHQRDDNRLENLHLCANQGEHRRLHRGDKHKNPRPREEPVTAPCATCGAPFVPKKKQSGYTRTCSFSCGQRLRYADRWHPCAVCSASTKNATCSRACSNRLRWQEGEQRSRAADGKWKAAS